MPPAEGKNDAVTSEVASGLSPDDAAAISPGVAPAVGSGTLTGHAIIAGFGLSGRAAANALIAKGIQICVIERNVDTVRRCQIAGLCIFQGDATDEDLLRRAGIESAAFFAATMPNDSAVLESVALARRLNPSVKIFARCEYVSTGMKAERKGADAVVIAEKVVATEFGKLVDAGAVRSGPGLGPFPDQHKSDGPESGANDPARREPTVVADLP